LRSDDQRYMRRALRLAARGWGRVAPNPLVGAVVVRDGVVIGEGWHQEYGGPHAEIHALAQAGARAEGATLYVSLEPCAHHGKTPPCTDAILRAGIRRVVYGASDANRKAAGGAAVLRTVGLAVVGGLEAEASRRLNAPFFHAHEKHVPWVALKLAQSLDGAIARGAGIRTTITGQRAQAEVHRLRAGFDAILVGAGTARSDDPLLTARGNVRPRKPPARVVFDTLADLAQDGRLIATISEAPVHVVHAGGSSAQVQALQDLGVLTHQVPASDAGVAPAAALRALWDTGLRSILCEGGAGLARSLIARDLVERIYLFIAPVVLGPEALRGLGAPLCGGWRLTEMRSFGNDALVVYDRVRAEIGEREG
jgi:diaminohydroxyphosphoribosylaminopyrimidine deaminase/5-amino-6-(5-phosphoribosylamino)uracil reductase